MRGDSGEIPATRVRPPNNDEGNTLTRSQRQRRHRPKETILVERINRAHEPEDSTFPGGKVPVSPTLRLSGARSQA